MKEADNFAFGPVRGRRDRSLTRLPLRAWLAYAVKGWQALTISCLLLVTALLSLAVAWSALSVATSRRAAAEARARWAARYRARHRAPARVPAYPAPGRHRMVPAAGRHRRPGLIHTFTVAGSHRPAPRPRLVTPELLTRVADWRPQPLRTVRRLRRSRRLTTVLAATMAVLILSGLMPVQAAVGDITTVAGRPDSGDGAAATGALIHLPQDVAVAPSGDVYIADTYNHRIRRVSTTGVITTVAGNGTSGFSGDGGAATAAQLRFPEGVWVASSGEIYVSDTGNNRVRRISTAGVITTVAGTGTPGFSGDGGPATSARLDDPKDLTTDSAGNLFIADSENHRVRRVSASGTITTYAGNGTEGYAGDGGAATGARLNDPSGVAFDTSTGTLYIADTENHRIRRVTSGGTINTWAGTGQQGDQNHPVHADKSTLNTPQRVAWSSNGIYISDTGNNRVKFVNTWGSISNAAGTGTAGFSGDGASATSGQLNAPMGIGVGSGGVYYIADSENHRVRRVTSVGVISTFAGKAHFGGDGGPATSASLNRPMGVASDGSGNVYIADSKNNRVRRVSAGTVSTVAGTGTAGSAGDGGAATSAQLNDPRDVAVDGAGNVYVADTANHKVRRINAAGNITTFAGTGVAGFSGNGGAATSAQLNSPQGVEVDAAGNVYIADTGNHRVRVVSTTGVITTVAGSGSASFCGDGGAATSACLENPLDVAVNAAGSLFIADFSNHRIRSVISGTIRTLAGNGSPSFSGDGGPATSASLNSPSGVDVDATGQVMIADSANNRIRRVSPTGTIRTVGGNGNFGFSGDGGPALSGEMAYPAHVALDPGGNLLVADLYNNRIRRIESLSLPGPTMTGTTPPSPANNNNPLVRGTATAGTTVNIYTTSNCTGPIVATGGAATFSGAGISVNVPDNSTTSFYATATDGNGGVSTCSSAPVVYVEDSTPPAPPTITLEPASPGSDQTPTWTFTADAGASVQCELSSGGVTLYPWVACASPHTFDLTGQPDAIYDFSVRATDAAGNQGAASGDAYVLDSTVPAAPVITVSPGTPSDDVTPEWEFTLEPGSSAECELSYGGAVVDPFGPCNSPHSYNLNGDPDGDYTFRVQARDGAGNPSAPVSQVYTLDTTDPAQPTVDDGPPSPGNSTSPSWSFTVDPDSTAECQLTRGGVVVSAWQACSSPDTHDLSGEPDGDYDHSVRAVDPAGNTGPAITSTYTLDTTGPGVNLTSMPGSPDNDLAPSWAFSTEPGASVECELRLGSNPVAPFGPCPSPQVFDLSGQPDGAYTFTVHATDAAGNTGDPNGSVYVLDTTPPVVDIISGPAAFSSEQNPEWAFTSEAGAITECELSSSTGGVLQPFTSCVSPQSYDLTALPDDSYTFTVRATDPAGNVGPVSAASYTLDTSGPTSSVTASPPSPGNSLTPSWSFTAEAGAGTECTLSNTGGVLSPWTPCVSPQSYNLAGQPEGDYTFSVRATDAAFNVGAPASSTYRLDRTAPGVSITASPATPGNSPAPSWSFTTESGATTECELSRGGVVVAPWGSCLSPKVYSLADQPDGTYTFRVRATDAAGNTGPAESSTYALDTTGPSVVLNGPSSPGSGRTPSWIFSSEPGASAECELSRGALVLQPYAPCNSPVSYDLNVQPDGTYTVRVRATDGVGNTGPSASASYELDTSGPSTMIVNSPSSPGSTTSISWAFTTDPGATTECELTRGGAVIHAFTPCSGSKGFDISGGPDGDYIFRVRARDTAGNTGADATSSYTLDRTPPATPVISGSPASPSSDKTTGWAFAAEAGVTTECELSRGGSVVQPYGPCGSPSEFDLAGLPDGDYTFSVRAVDALGNTSAAATSGYTLDTTGPTVSITGEPNSPDKGPNPTWDFSTEAGATTKCVLSRGGTDLYSDGTCVSPVTFDLSGEPDNTYTLHVTATDAAGNEGAEATSRYVLDTVVKEEPPAPPTEPEPQPTEPKPDRPAPEEPADQSVPAPARVGGRSLNEPEPKEEVQDPVPEPEVAREVSESQPKAKGALGEFLENVGTVAAGLLEQPAFPLGLIGVVFGFLVLQDRVDRRDPKLAMAPIYPDPHLYFQPQEGPGKVPSPSGGSVKGPMT